MPTPPQPSREAIIAELLERCVQHGDGEERFCAICDWEWRADDPEGSPNHNPECPVKRLAWLGDAPGWRCFHCGKVCATEAEAREHFGPSRLDPAICQVENHPTYLAMHRRARLSELKLEHPQAYGLPKLVPSRDIAAADIDLQWALRTLDADRSSTRKHILNARDRLAALASAPHPEPANLSLSDVETLLVSAVRYALGRKSYIVGLTCDIVRRANPSALCREVLLRDIDGHRGSFGMEMDHREWRKLRDWLVSAPSASEPEPQKADPTLVDDAEPIDVLRAVAYCARQWEGGARLVGNVRACDIARAIDAVEALVKAGDATIEQADQENWRCYNGTDASRLQQLEYALDNVAPSSQEPTP